MCLVHDMAESIVGDLTPHCGVPVEEKHRREEVSHLQPIMNDLGLNLMMMIDSTRKPWKFW